ncbi:hypothetical protein KM043_012856 [Ampulex compressa]|nr:hypothetical protein KM043_012856 [Ampulex compressa]
MRFVRCTFDILQSPMRARDIHRAGLDDRVNGLETLQSTGRHRIADVFQVEKLRWQAARILLFGSSSSNISRRSYLYCACKCLRGIIPYDTLENCVRTEEELEYANVYGAVVQSDWLSVSLGFEILRDRGIKSTRNNVLRRLD